MCAVTILVGRGSPELQQVRLLVRFSLKRLRFSLFTHTCVLLYSDTVRCPGDNFIKLGRTDASRQNSTTTNARSMSYRYTGVVLYQALCGVQRQLTVRAFVVWNSWWRRYAPQMRENLLPVSIIRRQKAATYDTCTEHPVGRTVITLHKPPVPHDPRAGSVQGVFHGRRMMYCPRI